MLVVRRSELPLVLLMNRVVYQFYDVIISLSDEVCSSLLWEFAPQINCHLALPFLRLIMCGSLDGLQPRCFILQLDIQLLSVVLSF